MLTNCKACQYTSEIHKTAIETEVARLSNMRGVHICDDDELLRRLEACSSCEHLDMNNVCLMCGCYVRIRTLLKDNRCPAPKKKW